MNENTVPIYSKCSTSAFMWLRFEAQRRGLASEREVIREMIEHAAGRSYEPKNVLETLRLNSYERIIMTALNDHPTSISQISKDSGKAYGNLHNTGRILLGKGWIRAVEEKYTGGRPAIIYAISDAGKIVMETEKGRLAAIEKKSIDDAKTMAMLAEKANPIPKRLRAVETDTPRGKFIQATLDALYNVVPELDDMTIEKKLAEALIDAESAVIGGETSTWERETEIMKVVGWTEPETPEREKEMAYRATHR